MAEDLSRIEDPSNETGPGPRPFREIPPLWLKILKMNQDFFASELPRASHIGVLLSILVVSGAALLLFALYALIAFLTSARSGPTSSVPLIPLVTLALNVLLSPFAYFYAIVGISFLCARILGGKGNFKGQAYLQSLCFIPVTIVGSAVGVVPRVGVLLTTLVTLYGLLLGVRVVMVSHRLTTVKAATATLAPILLGFALWILLFMAWFSWLPKTGWF